MEKIKTIWEEFVKQNQDDEKEWLRYLSKDIAFLKELREEYRNDWEMEQLISSIIHDEVDLFDSCKRRWENARRAEKELHRLRREGPDNKQPRDGNEAEGAKGIAPEPEEPYSLFR
jgi:hypothetical protein